jgi:hypothetical protein
MMATQSSDSLSPLSAGAYLPKFVDQSIESFVHFALRSRNRFFRLLFLLPYNHRSRSTTSNDRYVMITLVVLVVFRFGAFPGFDWRHRVSPTINLVQNS